MDKPRIWEITLTDDDPTPAADLIAEQIERARKAQISLETDDPSDTNTAIMAVEHGNYLLRLLDNLLALVRRMELRHGDKWNDVHPMEDQIAALRAEVAGLRYERGKLKTANERLREAVENARGFAKCAGRFGCHNGSCLACRLISALDGEGEG